MSTLGAPVSVVMALVLLANSTFSVSVAVTPRLPDLTKFRSAEFEIVFRFATDNIAVQLPGTGAFELDPDAGTARLRATFTFLGETFEVVIVDGNAWTRVSDEP